MHKTAVRSIPNAAEAVPPPPDRQFRVYVMQESGEAGIRHLGVRRNLDPPCVCVGPRACTLDERLHQHLAGHRASRFLHRYGRYPHPRPYSRDSPITTFIATRRAAEAMGVCIEAPLEHRGSIVFDGR